jgi:predicted transposase/invertase (TIGR01784 family)
LEGFLSELLRRQIKIKNILESESNKEYENDKFNRVDILVEADNEELVIVELQFYSQGDYFLRMLYGASKSIVEHIHAGETYDKVRKVYSINIVYFDLGRGEDYVYHGVSHFRGLHTNDELQLDEKQKTLYNRTFVGDLYPEYYILKVRNFNDVAKDTLDQWIYYLKHNKIQDDFTAQGLDKARTVLAFDKMSEEEKRQYWRNVEGWRIRESETLTAVAEGEARGEARGLEKGLEKGKMEEKVETARKMLKDGMPIDIIEKYTGLPKEQIEQLKIEQ